MALKGVPKSPEHRAKLAAVNLGKRHSAETKAKMSVSHTGKIFSAEHSAKISAARKGMVFSDETKRRMSESARVRAARPDQRARLVKMAVARGGFHGKHSAESKRQMSASAMGRPCQHAHREWYRGIAFRSSWEVRVAKALDTLEVRWEYEPRRFYFNGFTYLPDFFLPDDGAYWEVKGWMRGNDAEKIAAFRSGYPEYPLVVVGKSLVELLERSAAQKAA